MLNLILFFLVVITFRSVNNVLGGWVHNFVMRVFGVHDDQIKATPTKPSRDRKESV